MTILVIPDTQVKRGVPLDHIPAVGRLVHDIKPKTIVMIGDWWDMPSLSSYDDGKLASEGRRYQDDIDAGNEAMRMFVKQALRSRTYKPDMHFCVGNHEQRILKHVESHGCLAGKFSLDDLYLEGWKVHPFLTSLRIQDVFFSHYFYNTMSGRPFSGAVETMLKNIKRSFVMGHQQRLAFGRAPTAAEDIQGLVCGAFYLHDEEYKGPQGHDHWKGVCMLHDLKGGLFNLETMDIETMLEAYG